MIVNVNAMFTERDWNELRTRDIPRDEALRQLQLLQQPPSSLRLVRPCTIGDGIVRLEERAHAGLLALADDAIARGRVSKFVPASGAATRMFNDLIAARAGGERPSRIEAGAKFFAELDRFPFADELRRRSGVWGMPRDEAAERRVLRTLLDDMRYAELPKGLIAFHRMRTAVRTAFEEQLLEGAQYTRARDDVARTHFTVAPEFRGDFEDSLTRIRSWVEAHTHARLAVTFSEQRPSSDTLAATPSGEPFRTEDRALLFRPSGHGALLGNLQDLAGDLVVIKNIDNVRPIEASAEIVHWKRLLVGCLVRDAAEGADDRPVRVCGVVKNAGEPGGAPFWVEDAQGRISAQIVESSQVDPTDMEQRRIFESSTHFNPVDLVCSVRNRQGVPFDLAAFVDQSAVFRSKKTHQGRDLLALERPGLWNGAMAYWHTMFVEVPAATFAPVKTVFDLLRPEHQSL
jgi:hypothetical protein